jgi:hypothetical protein
MRRSEYAIHLTLEPRGERRHPQANVGADSDRAGFGAVCYLKHLPFHVLKMDGEPAPGRDVGRLSQVVASSRSCIARARCSAASARRRASWARRRAFSARCTAA